MGEKKVVRMRDVYRVALGGTASWCPKPKKSKTPAANPTPAPPAEAAPPEPPAEAPPAPAAPLEPAQTQEAAPPPAPDPAPPAQGLDPVVPPDEFTAAQDETLLRMKTQENKSWKEIAEALGKPQWAAKKRLPIIKPKEEAPAPDPPKKKQKKQPPPPPTIVSEVDISEHDGGDYVFLDEDENFSREECELLARLHIQDADELFGRIASRFFDHTGRRLSARDVQDKLGIK